MTDEQEAWLYHCIKDADYILKSDMAVEFLHGVSEEAKKFIKEQLCQSQ